MKKKIEVFLFLFLTAFCAQAASPVEPTIAPLDKGQPAPWAGVLLNASAVGSLKFDYENEKEKIDAIVQKAVNDVLITKNAEIEKEKASCTSIIKQKEAEIEEKTEKTNLLEKQNKKLSEDLLNSPSAVNWFSIGFAGGMAFTILTAFAVTQVVN